MSFSLRDMRISIRSRLIAAFLSVIILPLGITVGYYLLENKRMLKGPSGPTVDFPQQARAVADEAARIYGRQGSLRGLEPVIDRYRHKIRGRIQVIDINGWVVADTEREKPPAAVRYNTAELGELLSWPANNMEMNEWGDFENKNFRINAGSPVKAGGKTVGLVVVGIEYAEMWELFMGILTRTLLVGVGSIIAVCLLFAWRISRGIARPLRELVTATSYIAEGNLDSRVRISARNELGDLGEAFNTMVDKLQESLSREKALDNSRRELIANVSHDLRTPLTSIRGYVEGLRDGVAQNPDKVKRYLEVIHEKTLSLDRLIADLFRLSQLDTGQLEMKPQRIGASELLTGIAAQFQPDIERAGINIHTEIPEGLPVIEVDRDRIEQALGNIIENAIKYTPSGGTISLMAMAEPKGVRVMVADTGEGIAPEDLPRVFERLYRGEKSRSRQSGGTGLGLAIAKQIIEAHNGRIWVESEKGQGSRFYISLQG